MLSCWIFFALVIAMYNLVLKYPTRLNKPITLSQPIMLDLPGLCFSNRSNGRREVMIALVTLISIFILFNIPCWLDLYLLRFLPFEVQDSRNIRILLGVFIFI